MFVVPLHLRLHHSTVTLQSNEIDDIMAQSTRAARAIVKEPEQCLAHNMKSGDVCKWHATLVVGWDDGMQ
jgi:hypothetical protein